MKYICLDPGLKHTGVAVSYEGVIAVPHSTIEANSPSALTQSVLVLVNQIIPDVLVIGQPASGPLLHFAASLKDQLEAIISVPVLLHPEDLSSKLATVRLIEAGTKKSKRQLASHQSAAAIILQDYFDTRISKVPA